MRKGCMALMALAVIASACGARTPTAPTPAVVVTPEPVFYTINIPDFLTTYRLAGQYPYGIALSPVQAQLAYDYTQTYGAPNAYWGPVSPPTGVYLGTGIAIAPEAIAQKPIFRGDEWPGGLFDADRLYEWKGMFVFTRAGEGR